MREKYRNFRRLTGFLLCCILVLGILPHTTAVVTISNTDDIIAWSQTLPTGTELRKLTWAELVERGYVQTAKTALAYIADNQEVTSPTVIAKMGNLVALCEYAAYLEAQTQSYAVDDLSWASINSRLATLINALQGGSNVRPLFSYMQAVDKAFAKEDWGRFSELSYYINAANLADALVEKASLAAQDVDSLGEAERANLLTVVSRLNTLLKLLGENGAQVSERQKALDWISMAVTRPDDGEAAVRDSLEAITAKIEAYAAADTATEPAETQPVETQADDVQPDETQAVETQPVKTQTDDVQTDETQPVEALAVEPWQVETQPANGLLSDEAAVGEIVAFGAAFAALPADTQKKLQADQSFSADFALISDILEQVDDELDPVEEVNAAIAFILEDTPVTWAGLYRGNYVIAAAYALDLISKMTSDQVGQIKNLDKFKVFCEYAAKLQAEPLMNADIDSMSWVEAANLLYILILGDSAAASGEVNAPGRLFGAVGTGPDNIGYVLYEHMAAADAPMGWSYSEKWDEVKGQFNALFQAYFSKYAAALVKITPDEFKDYPMEELQDKLLLAMELVLYGSMLPGELPEDQQKELEELKELAEQATPYLEPLTADELFEQKNGFLYYYLLTMNLARNPYIDMQSKVLEAVSIAMAQGQLAVLAYVSQTQMLAQEFRALMSDFMNPEVSQDDKEVAIQGWLAKYKALPNNLKSLLTGGALMLQQCEVMLAMLHDGDTDGLPPAYSRIMQNGKPVQVASFYLGSTVPHVVTTTFPTDPTGGEDSYQYVLTLAIPFGMYFTEEMWDSIEVKANGEPLAEGTDYSIEVTPPLAVGYTMCAISFETSWGLDTDIQVTYETEVNSTAWFTWLANGNRSYAYWERLNKTDKTVVGSNKGATMASNYFYLYYNNLGYNSEDGFDKDLGSYNLVLSLKIYKYSNYDKDYYAFDPSGTGSIGMFNPLLQPLFLLSGAEFKLEHATQQQFTVLRDNLVAYEATADGEPVKTDALAAIIRAVLTPPDRRAGAMLVAAVGRENMMKTLYYRGQDGSKFSFDQIDIAAVPEVRPYYGLNAEGVYTQTAPSSVDDTGIYADKNMMYQLDPEVFFSSMGEAVPVGDGGGLMMGGLALGTYTLTEVKAPDGYALNDEVYTIEFFWAAQDPDTNGLISVEGPTNRIGCKLSDSKGNTVFVSTLGDLGLPGGLDELSGMLGLGAGNAPADDKSPIVSNFCAAMALPLGNDRLSLVVSKEVLDGEDEDYTKDFTFNLTMRDPLGNICKNVSYARASNNSTTYKTSLGNVIDWVEDYEFTLKHGESIAFTNVPAGSTYEITEIVDGEEYTTKVYQVTDDGGKVELTDGVETVKAGVVFSGLVDYVGEKYDTILFQNKPVIEEPEDTKPEDTKPNETKPAETKPSTTKPDSGETPKTGDISHPETWLVLLCAAAIGMIVLYGKRKTFLQKEND